MLQRFRDALAVLRGRKMAVPHYFNTVTITQGDVANLRWLDQHGRQV